MNKIDKTDTLLKILADRRFTVDYYQREYRWGRKQIEQMMGDLCLTFLEFYDSESHGSVREVKDYGYYYMGSIICTGGHQIIDGQQRLTSLTLLLIYLNNLQKKCTGIPYLPVRFEHMIFSDDYGEPCFNLDVEERRECFKALYNEDASYVPDNESNINMMERYGDIEYYFPEELKGEALPYFIYWLKDKVLLLEIDTPSEDEAHTIFLTMNDRGLSLNSAEMMKAYIIQQVREEDREFINEAWKKNINRIKSEADNARSGVVNAEDVEFISLWLRSRYAMSLRETRKGSEDRDFELLGDKFHTWVRQNARQGMHLEKSEDFYGFVAREMTFVTDIYLRLEQYCRTLTPGFETVYYNANRDLNYQNMLIISTLDNGDAPEVIDRKIKLVAAFVDIFASVRIFNYKKVNWNTNKTLLFRIMVNIRGKDVVSIGKYLTNTLKQMDVNIDGLIYFELNQYTGRYMLHMLARLVSFVNEQMGYPSDFDAYMDRSSKTAYDIEHILPDDYETYKDSFTDVEDFQKYRRKFGNLLILTRDKNRSYQDMSYEQKVQHYLTDNVLARSLNPGAYVNNPRFLRIVPLYGFKAVDKFEKQAVAERTELYLRMARSIWNPDNLKKLAGGWEDDTDFVEIPAGNQKSFTVEYAGRSWPDAVKYGFLSADLGNPGKSIANISVGDRVFCHISAKGFVGVGVCTAAAVPMSEFRVAVADAARTPGMPEMPLISGVAAEVERPGMPGMSVTPGEPVEAGVSGISATPGDLVADVEWLESDAKLQCMERNEWFIGVLWLRTTDLDNGYWERGLKTVPLAAYELGGDTHARVLKHFRIREAERVKNVT